MDTGRKTTTEHPGDFEQWWNIPGEWVEELNQRRSGWSGMMRAEVSDQTYYIKKQCNHLYHSIIPPFKRPTVEREYRNLLRLKALGIRVPEPVFHGARKTAAGIEGLLVTKEQPGFTPLTAQNNLDASLRHELAKTIGHTLGLMHRANLQHSCLYDKHIFVRWNDGTPEAALIDLEKLHRPFFPWRAARHDLNQLRRHHPLWLEDDWATLLKHHRLTLTKM